MDIFQSKQNNLYQVLEALLIKLCDQEGFTFENCVCFVPYVSLLNLVKQEKGLFDLGKDFGDMDILTNVLFGVILDQKRMPVVAITRDKFETVDKRLSAIFKTLFTTPECESLQRKLCLGTIIIVNERDVSKNQILNLADYRAICQPIVKAR